MLLTVGYSHVKLSGASAFVIDLVKKKCTVIYSTKVRWGKRLKDKQCFINLYKNGQFPIGLLPYFKHVFQLKDIDCEILDMRKIPPRDSRLIFNPELPLKLRAYQQEAMLAGRSTGQGFFDIPTGGGKTHLAGGLINAAGCRCLYMVPTKNLLHQTAKEFKIFFGEKAVGVIGDGEWSSYQPILVATVQSLWSQFHTVEFSKSFDGIGMVIADECFVAGTLVKTPQGTKNIKDVKVGDLIYNSKGISSVEDFSIKQIPLNHLLRLDFSNGEVIFCSKEHVFFTHSGEVKAINLKGIICTHFISIIKDVLNVKPKKVFGYLSDMQRVIFGMVKNFKILHIKLSAQQSRIKGFVFKDYEKHKSKKKPYTIRENEEKQSISGQGHFTKDNRNKKAKRNFAQCACNTWRKWVFNRTPKEISQRIGLGNGVISKNKNKRAWLSYKLQTRYSKRRIKDWYRSRRAISLWKKKSVGYKKGFVFNGIRVDNIAVYKQGSNDKLFKGVIGDKERSKQTITMYDLGVKGEPNYFVGSGFLVHNCHHTNIKTGPGSKATEQNTWYKILIRVPAYYRFGMTATPGAPDSKEYRLLEAATGSVVYKVTPQELIKLGHLVHPNIEFYTINHNKAYKNWKEAKEQGICNNDIRNTMIKRLAIKAAITGKRVLITTDRKEIHGKNLYQLIGSDRAVYADGDSSKKHRDQAKLLFESGKKRILIGTLYNEGVNMPKMDIVINAYGGKSEKLAIQKFGRALRPSAGKTVGTLIDFYDEDADRWIYDYEEQRRKQLPGVLITHSKARVKAYEDAGYTVKIKKL